MIGLWIAIVRFFEKKVNFYVNQLQKYVKNVIIKIVDKFFIIERGKIWKNIIKIYKKYMNLPRG